MKKKAHSDSKSSSRWYESLGGWIDLLQKVFAFGGSALAVAAVVLLLTVGQKHTIVVNRISTAEDAKKRGYDEPALARELADSIRRMMQQPTTLKDHREVFSYDNEPVIQIDSSNLTMNSLTELIERYRTKRRYVVTGELTDDGTDHVRLTVRVENQGAVTINGSLSQLDRAINQAAEYVLSSTEPYVFTAYLLTAGRYQEALHWIHVCLATLPLTDDRWVYNLWGIYFLERNEYDLAIEQFRRATQSGTSFGPGLYNWGLALEGQGQSERHKLQEALSMYEKAFAAWKDVRPLAGEGRVLLEIGRDEESINVFTEAAIMAPRDQEIRIGFARALLADNKFDKAVEEFEAAADLGDLDKDTLLKYATTLDAVGDVDAAVEAYKRFLDEDPSAGFVRKRLQLLAEQRVKR